MTKEIPLSKERLFQILSRYQPGVTMELVGGYDTGVYFKFTGKAIRPFDRGEHVGGRIVRDWGFTSEAMEMSRAERFGRGGLRHGVSLFEERYQTRKHRFERWLASYRPPT